jgi:copper chaperone CopZ
MKKLAFAFAAVLALSGTAFAKEATTTMKVSGWHCAACSGKTESAVKAVKGVQTAKADKATNTLTVTYDDAATQPAEVEKAVVAAGYKVEK